MVSTHLKNKSQTQIGWFPQGSGRKKKIFENHHPENLPAKKHHHIIRKLAQA